MNNKEKAKHTPGPWRTGDMYNTVFGPPSGNPCPEIVASVHRGNRANARLIAAAPDLLIVCEELLSLAKNGAIEYYPVSFVNALMAAIRKAKGE